jgi:hypothetical protein
LAWDHRPHCSFLVIKVYAPLLKTLNVLLFDFSLLGMTVTGRMCDYKLLGVNGTLCGIFTVRQSSGNGKFWPVDVEVDLS